MSHFELRPQPPRQPAADDTINHQGHAILNSIIDKSEDDTKNANPEEVGIGRSKGNLYPDMNDDFPPLRADEASRAEAEAEAEAEAPPHLLLGDKCGSTPAAACMLGSHLCPGADHGQPDEPFQAASDAQVWKLSPENMEFAQSLRNMKPADPAGPSFTPLACGDTHGFPLFYVGAAQKLYILEVGMTASTLEVEQGSTGAIRDPHPYIVELKYAPEPSDDRHSHKKSKPLPRYVCNIGSLVVYRAQHGYQDTLFGILLDVESPTHDLWMVRGGGSDDADGPDYDLQTTTDEACADLLSCDQSPHGSCLRVGGGMPHATAACPQPADEDVPRASASARGRDSGHVPFDVACLGEHWLGVGLSRDPPESLHGQVARAVSDSAYRGSITLFNMEASKCATLKAQFRNVDGADLQANLVSAL